jgi:predicted phage tail protein
MVRVRRGAPLSRADIKFGLILTGLGAVFVALDLWLLVSTGWVAGPRGQNAMLGIIGLIMVISGTATLLGYKPKLYQCPNLGTGTV